jgi:hypothetical protein
LTRQLDRSKVPVMGKLWGKDAVTPNRFTTDLSIASALAESPLDENLLLVGTDDGLVQITEDGGKNWRKIESFAGVPEQSYVSCVCASNHDKGTIYASFNNWQRGDFKPYLLRSKDGGKSWTSIAANLPERHCVWSIVEDHVNKDLLFVGTEFGLFVTLDGGKRWIQMREGVPTVAFRDLAIHKRENDLVCATFGRGFFVLDEYTALRHLIKEQTLVQALFPPRKCYVYEEKTRDKPAGLSFAAANPPPGVLLTYNLGQINNAKGTFKVLLTVSAPDGSKVRQIAGPTSTGLHRVNWDLRNDFGAMVAPGKYRVNLQMEFMGAVINELSEPQFVEVLKLPE